MKNSLIKVSWKRCIKFSTKIWSSENLIVTEQQISILRPIHTAQTNANNLQQTSLLEFVGSVSYPCWRWLELVFTRLNMLIDIELVGVCWCSVNMTVIFHKILNPTANLSQLVCWRLSVRCELAFRMIPEGSCDTEDCSNDAENSALITGINHISKYIQTESCSFKL